MPAPKKSAGQRGSLTSSSGRKQRSATSTSHTGSRVEPSHEVERVRVTRDTKTAAKAAVAVKSAKSKSKAPASTKSSTPRPGTAAMKVGRKKG